jgi:hypothetical protein
VNEADTRAAQIADQTRTLRDVAQLRLQHTAKVGEDLYHQATAKAAALAIRAEFPTAAYLELEPSDQEGVNFVPGAILDTAGAPIAGDPLSTGMALAERWEAVVAPHYGPLTDLPADLTYDDVTCSLLPLYPWLVVGTGGSRVERLDLRAAADLDLSDAIAAAFPEPVPPSEELGALGTDGVVVPAALIDTGARHHPALPGWPADLAAPEVSAKRAADGETRLTVAARGVELLTVAGVWTGEVYTDDVDWHRDSALSDPQRSQVEGWARQVWIRLTDALDNVVDHAVTATIEPVIARITTDHPSPAAVRLNALSPTSVALTTPQAARADGSLSGASTSAVPRFTHPAFDGATFEAVAYHQGWNGWAAPVVNQATLDDLLGRLDPQWLRGWIDSDDVVHLEHIENGVVTDHDTVSPNVDGTYDLGLLGWTFEIAEAPSRTPEVDAPSSASMPASSPTASAAADVELGW